MTGTRRRTTTPRAFALGAALVASLTTGALAGCSSSGDSDGAASTTTTAAGGSTTTTMAATTAPATTETTAPSPVTTAPPVTAAPTTAPPVTAPPPTSAPAGKEAEPLAVAFVRAILTGGDASQYVRTASVVTDAKALLQGYGSTATVAIHPTYVDPNAQAGVGGQCQLIGDVTLQCAVAVGSSGDDGGVLVGVLVSNIPPEAGSPDAPTVPNYVAGIEGLAG